MSMIQGLRKSVAWAAGQSPCRIFAAYEDLECGTVAKETCSGLARSVASDVECEWNLWRFDVLDLDRKTFKEARRADVLVVSLTGVTPLPEDVHAWLERAMAKEESEKRALVGLPRGKSRKMLRLAAYQSLEEIADNGRLALFAQTFELSGRATSEQDESDESRTCFGVPCMRQGTCEDGGSMSDPCSSAE